MASRSIVLAIPLLGMAVAGCAEERKPIPGSHIAAVQESEQIRAGRIVAEENCASCHAIGRNDVSPNPRAPLFRTVLARYNADTLATELIVGVRVAHAPMPEFEFNPATADALVAYLRSVEDTNLGEGRTRAHGDALPRASQAAVETGNVNRGRAFAKAHCSSCHSIRRSGRSPYRPAPPLRTLNAKYDVEGLAEAFAEGIIVGHEGEKQMPEFVLQPDEIDDLIVYLKSLKPYARRR